MSSSSIAAQPWAKAVELIVVPPPVRSSVRRPAGAGLGHVLLVDLVKALSRLHLRRCPKERVHNDTTDHDALVGIGQAIERDGGHQAAATRGLDLADIGDAVDIQTPTRRRGLLCSPPKLKLTGPGDGVPVPAEAGGRGSRRL